MFILAHTLRSVLSVITDFLFCWFLIDMKKREFYVSNECPDGRPRHTPYGRSLYGFAKCLATSSRPFFADGTFQSLILLNRFAKWPKLTTSRCIWLAGQFMMSPDFRLLWTWTGFSPVEFKLCRCVTLYMDMCLFIQRDSWCISCLCKTFMLVFSQMLYCYKQDLWTMKLFMIITSIKTFEQWNCSWLLPPSSFVVVIPGSLTLTHIGGHRRVREKSKTVQFSPVWMQVIWGLIRDGRIGYPPPALPSHQEYDPWGSILTAG